MKKNLFIFAAAAMIIAGCAKENGTDDGASEIVPQNSFSCSFAINGQTKTTITPGDETYNIYWEEDDVIEVSNDGGSSWHNFTISFLSEDKSNALFTAATNETIDANFFKADNFKAKFGDAGATVLEMACGQNVKHLPMEAECGKDHAFAFNASKPVLAITIPSNVNATKLVVKHNDGGSDVCSVEKNSEADPIAVFYVPVEEGTFEYDIEAYDGSDLIAESMKMQVAASLAKGNVYPFDFAPTREVKGTGVQTLCPYPATYNVRIKNGIENAQGDAVSIQADDTVAPSIINISAKNYGVGDDYSVEKLDINAPDSHVDIEHGNSVNVTSKTSKNSLVVKSTFHIKKLTTGKGSVVVEGIKDNQTIQKNVDSLVIANTDENKAGVQITIASTNTIEEDNTILIINELEYNPDGEKPITIIGTQWQEETAAGAGNFSIESDNGTTEIQNVNLNFEAVASVGGVKFSSLDKAIMYASTGATITLEADNALDERVVVPAGKDIIIDLNGHNIVYTNTATALASGIITVCNGGTLTVKGEGEIKPGEGATAYAGITVTKKGDDDFKHPATVTIEGGTVKGLYYGISGNGNRNNTVINIKGGTITCTASDGTGIYNPQNGTINITGGTVEGATGIYMKSGSIGTFTGGTVRGTGAKNPYKYNAGGFESTGDALVVDNCSYPGGRPSVTIAGGALESTNGYQIGAYYNASETAISDIFSTDNTLTAPAGYTWNEAQTSGTYKLKKATGVAAIGTKSYETLTDAIDEVQSGETIVVLKGIVLEEGLTVDTGDKEFTLDLNGQTIAIAESGFDFSANGTNKALRSGIPQRFAIVINGDGTMNIVDNSGEADGKIETKNFSYGTVKTILVDGNAVVNLNSGTISADYAPFYVVGYTGTTQITDPTSAPKPTLNVNGGKISGKSVGIGIKGNTAKLTVTDGVIESVDGDAISTNGTTDWYDGGNCCITISGGTIKSTGGAALYLAAESPTTITGGLVEGAEGIAVKGGTLSISGSAVVKGTGAKADAKAASSGHTDTGSGIYVEDTYQDHKPVVEISGGKFSSENNLSVEYYTNKDAQAANKGKITLTGGLYAQKPDDAYLGKSYEVIGSEVADYPWTIVAAKVAIIGETKYTSLSEALNAAKEGEAVYIIPNQLEETVSASNDNNIQLIMDGKALIGDLTFGGSGTLIVRAEELNVNYYHCSNYSSEDDPTIPAKGAGGIMGKISTAKNATAIVMLRENHYSGPFEGNVELRGGFYNAELGLQTIKNQTPGGIGLVVEDEKQVEGYNLFYVPEVPESYLVHVPAEFLAAYFAGELEDNVISYATLGYGLYNILNPSWLKYGNGVGGPTGNDYFPDDVYAFFTNLKDNDSYNPKNAYQEWYCDFEISYSEPIAADYQSGIWGYYGGHGFGCWLPKDATEGSFGMMKSTFGRWKYESMLNSVGMFLCGPKNLNSADSGKVITVNLKIYPDDETPNYIITNKVVYTIPEISN